MLEVRTRTGRTFIFAHRQIRAMLCVATFANVNDSLANSAWFDLFIILSSIIYYDNLDMKWDRFISFYNHQFSMNFAANYITNSPTYWPNICLLINFVCCSEEIQLKSKLREAMKMFVMFYFMGREQIWATDEFRNLSAARNTSYLSVRYHLCQSVLCVERVEAIACRNYVFVTVRSSNTTKRGSKSSGGISKSPLFLNPSVGASWHRPHMSEKSHTLWN